MNGDIIYSWEYNIHIYIYIDIDIDINDGRTRKMGFGKTVYKSFLYGNIFFMWMGI